VKKIRDPKTGFPKDVIIKPIGYLEDYIEQFTDPIAHFKELARLLSEEEKENRSVTLTFNMNEELTPNTNNRKNLGYAAIIKLYHELELDRFFINKARHQNFKYSTNAIMILLVVSRLLSPGSKKKAFAEKNRYFERFNFLLHDMYRALTHFAATTTEVQRHINERIRACYGRNTSTTYYDVTNYYFTTDKEDELRKRGYSKDRKRKPIVQMGLLMDDNGIPLHYELFEGNILDKSTFRSVIGEVRRNYDTGRIIVVADMGIVTGDNIFYLVGGEKREKPLNGYVFSFTIRGGTAKFKEYVLDSKGYIDSNGEIPGRDTDFMVKSRKIARDINVTMESGQTQQKVVYEKQVIFWSKKYADRAKAEREAVILKAIALVNDPGKYNSSTAYGAAKYVKNISFDKNTHQVVDTGKTLSFDEAKVREEEKLDGYYSIVTSELEMPDNDIINTYRGLWEIEETFKITKETLEARPVYASLRDSIEAHFLTCFIALVIIRLLQKITEYRFSCERIIECLNHISCSLEEDNIYLFNYRSEISEELSKALNIDFLKRRLTLADIKNILAKSKR
jgi:hypothetical protein